MQYIALLGMISWAPFNQKPWNIKQKTTILNRPTSLYETWLSFFSLMDFFSPHISLVRILAIA